MQDYEETGNPQFLQQSWIAKDLKMEAGVLLLMTAAALLEEIIYSYAVTFFDADSYEQHLGNVRTVSKWLLLPRLCQGKEIDEDHPAINALKELVLARNAVIHPKRQDMGLNIEKADKKVKKEVARFFSACRNARKTVDALVKLLNDSAPSKSKN